jgi:hypothetical protein
VVELYFVTIRNKLVAIVDYGTKPEEKKTFLAVAKQIHTRNDNGKQWIEPKLCCRIQYLIILVIGLMPRFNSLLSYTAGSISLITY